MNQNYTAVVKQQANCWIGWIEEVAGVNCQEETREELLDTLRVTLTEAIELNRAEALHTGRPASEILELAKIWSVPSSNNTQIQSQTKYIATQQPTAASQTTERRLAWSAM